MQSFSIDKKSNVIHFLQLLVSHPFHSFLIPFLMVVIGRFIIFSNIEIPMPLIQDEFSYLLASDTFASFRMTNPMHPFWEHFESIHLLVTPSYMSKYPPMQGLVLAIGQWLFGQPWIAIVLSMAVFCGLLPWTLRAWLPADWAMIGALIATYKIGIISYWTDSYWGGSIAAIGGALVLGSTGRLAAKPSTPLLTIFALGSCILINSRPFEGMVFILGCTGYLLYQWRGKYRNFLPILTKQFALPLLTIIIPVISIMGLYNYRVTGHVTELPYTAFNKQYAIWSPFVWQQKPNKEPLYRLDFIKRCWVDWDNQTKIFSRKHPIITFINDFNRTVQFYFGNTFYIFLLFCVQFFIFGQWKTIFSALFDKPNRSIMLLLLFYTLATSIILEVIPHYTAPAAALIYLAIVMVMRSIARFSYNDIPFGKIICLILLGIFIPSVASTMQSEENRFLYSKKHFLNKRKQVLAILEHQPGSHLVFVTQGRKNDPNEIWVFNQANIDNAKIIWANDISPEKNQRLITYYHNKKTLWKLIDDDKLSLTSYSNPKADPMLTIKNPKPPIE